jgi:hypothetical protein
MGGIKRRTGHGSTPGQQKGGSKVDDPRLKGNRLRSKRGARPLLGPAPGIVIEPLGPA